MHQRDKQGAGGNISHGLRVVRIGGWVKFDGFWHKDEALMRHVGEDVMVQAEDAFFSEKVAIHTQAGRFICYAKNMYHEMLEGKRQI